MDPAYIISFALVLSLVLMRINRSEMSPNIARVNRWLRWGIFSAGGAYVLKRCGLAEHPFWMLVLIFATLWFLWGTFFYWMLLRIHSRSDQPLFPRYEPGDSGENWPTQPRFLKMRDEIRASGFTHLCSMRWLVVENIWSRILTYKNATATTHLQVVFAPSPNGASATALAFSTLTSDGCRYETDNIHVPYGGFYPENWFVERKPWTRSLTALLKHHENRLAKDSKTPVPDTADPLETMNAQRNAIEQLNIEMGFLAPPHEHGKSGRITSAGLHRMWKEHLMLNYLGRPLRYL